MAVEIGTATNHKDLLAKLATFLSTNAALVAASQNWTINRQTADELLLMAPGLTTAEEIYCAIGVSESIGTDVYNWTLYGATGYLAGETVHNQPGHSPAVHTSLWNSAIPYWFIASGQRVIVVAKVSTTYHTVYLGKFFPYATPAQYPYPLYIGGDEDTALVRWSSTDGYFSSPWNPGSNTAWFADPGATWLAPKNKSSYNPPPIYLWPYMDGPSNADDRINGMRENIDGSYTLLPLIIAMDSPALGLMGELDGIYYCSGAANAAENIITIGADDYLVVNNIFRTTRGEYAAIKLE